MKQLTEELRNITVKEVLGYAVFIVSASIALVLAFLFWEGTGY